MSTNDSEIHEWGMTFINRVDEVINGLTEDQQQIKDAWLEGDADFVLSEISLQEFLTDEQMEWVAQFLSEI